MSKILIVEDDKNIVANLKELLLTENFQVVTANSQTTALQRIEEEKFDLILLDINLPDGSGYAVCSVAKSESSDNINRGVPVIFITAYDDEASAVTGLDMGADDYITKPFRPRELVSRIKNTLKRADKTSQVVEFENIKVDASRGTVFKGDKEIFLSVLEYRLLLVFFNNKGKVLSRNQLLEEIWDIAGEYVNDNTLTVYIKRLREKIEDNPQKPDIIKTIRGVGYRIGD